MGRVRGKGCLASNRRLEARPHGVTQRRTGMNVRASLGSSYQKGSCGLGQGTQTQVHLHTMSIPRAPVEPRVGVEAAFGIQGRGGSTLEGKREEGRARGMWLGQGTPVCESGTGDPSYRPQYRHTYRHLPLFTLISTQRTRVRRVSRHSATFPPTGRSTDTHTGTSHSSP